ncbi:MAG: putative urocanate hydratase [Parcubacteria group bacterium GW2011_GWA2_47_10]|nr:MAG: putative urocanate hydratase [Parcubacteria group bacterium GW2011_GWA2_47_10]
MHMAERPAFPIKASTGPEKECKTWDTEAALRMLYNNLDPDVALMSLRPIKTLRG